MRIDVDAGEDAERDGGQSGEAEEKTERPVPFLAVSIVIYPVRQIPDDGFVRVMELVLVLHRG